MKEEEALTTMLKIVIAMVVGMAMVAIKYVPVARRQSKEAHLRSYLGGSVVVVVVVLTKFIVRIVVI